MKPTWEDLAKREPALSALRRRVESIEDDPRAESFCANAVWYGYDDRPSLKAELCGLVGWSARRPDALLRSPEAYDVAYESLYYALPDCRGRCECSSVLEVSCPK